MAGVRLSVVVPAHDAGRWLAEALDSLLEEVARTGLGAGQAEVVVVDDASTDDTARVLSGYGKDLQVLRHEDALGPSLARNAGVAASRGDILAFHDADDLVLPGRLTRLLAMLEAEPGCDLVFGNGLRIDEAGTDLQDPVVPARIARRLARGVRTADLLQGSWLYLQGLAMRRDAFDRLGGLRFPCAEDLDLGLRASRTLSMAFVDRPLFAYRRHPLAMSASEERVATTALEVLETFLRDDPVAREEIGPAAIGRALARRLARLARHRARRGDTAGAASLLRRAVAVDPRMPRWRWRLLRHRIAGLRGSP